MHAQAHVTALGATSILLEHQCGHRPDHHVGSHLFLVGLHAWVRPGKSPAVVRVDLCNFHVCLALRPNSGLCALHQWQVGAHYHRCESLQTPLLFPIMLLNISAINCWLEQLRASFVR